MGFSGIASDSDKNYDSSKGEMGAKMYVWLLESYDPIPIMFNNYIYNSGRNLMWFLVDLSMLENPVNHSGLENYFKIGFCPPGNCSLKEIVLSSICLTTIIFSISLIWYSWDVEWTEGKFNLSVIFIIFILSRMPAYSKNRCSKIFYNLHILMSCLRCWGHGWLTKSLTRVNKLVGG